VMHHVVLEIMVIIMDVAYARQIPKRKQLVIYNLVLRVHACVLLIITATMDHVHHVRMDMKMLLVIHNSVQHVLVQQSHRVRQVNMVMVTDVQHVQLIQWRRTLVTHKTVLYAHANVKQIIVVIMEYVQHVQRATHVQKVMTWVVPIVNV